MGLANGTNDTANNSMSTFRGEYFYDFVASGCVWSGDSYGGTRNASQTSGVVYIGSVRLVVAAVSARLFTASKDTYIDVNGSGVQVYTEVTNNAASPALAAGSIRIGIIITAAGSIAAATSVNQGQETLILPIASSIPYQVTDSLGNLICGRDPDRMTLGQRLITANLAGLAGTSATPVQLTGLSCPVIVPSNRKVIVELFSLAAFTSVAATLNQSIWDGVVSSGTRVALTDLNTAAGSSEVPTTVSTPAITPSATSKTYNGGIGGNTGTQTLQAAATAPAYIRVRLA